MSEQSLRERLHATHHLPAESRYGRMKQLLLWAIPGALVAGVCIWGFLASGLRI